LDTSELTRINAARRIGAEHAGMAEPSAGSALLAAFAGIELQFQLPLVLLAWMAILRLPPAERVGLHGSLLLYVLGLAGLVGGATLALFERASAAPVREFAVLLLGLAGIRLAAIFLFRVLLPAAGLRRPRMLEDLAAFAGYVLWAMVRLSHVGLDLGSIVTTSAVITAIVAFSLQETLGNIFGGATLQLEDSIHLDDWIRVDDVVGRVVDIRWRSTVVETRNWETVVIPNSMLMKGRFTILGRRIGQPVQWRRWVWFNAYYHVPPRRVIATVEDALRRARIAHVASEPAPNCVLMGIDGNTVRYALRYWLTDLGPDDPTDSAVRERIFAAFRRAGIEFAFDEQIVHLVPEGAAREARRRRRELEQRVDILRRIALFASLSEAEREQVAAHLVYAPFLAGETLTRQGDVAHWLYLMVSGDAEVVLDDGGGRRRSLGVIRSGGSDALFGETGMLTGAPRSASVVALTDVECYRLDKEGFEQVLKARPAIADEISGLMAQRSADLSAARDELGAEARQRLLESRRGELLSRIRRFFALDQG
jgi:small-conductance mechanosensitive channel/CRP-like cAMP-binding protein